MADLLLGHVKSGQIPEKAVLVLHLSDEVLALIDAEGLKAEELLDGQNIHVTDNGDGTVTLATTPDMSVDTLSHNLSYAPTGTEGEGTFYWSSEDRTISLVLENGVILQLGKEQTIDVLNQTGDTIQNGSVVAFAGAVGASGKIQGQLGIADGTLLPQYHIGIATRDILNGLDGEVTTFGKVRGLDTSGAPYGEVWHDGDILFVSPTIQGGLTNVQPDAPQRLITIGAVIRAHAVQGSIFVRPTFGIKLTGLDDVDGTPFDTDGQILAWNQAGQVFESLQLVVSNVPHTISSASVSAGDTISSESDVLRLSGSGGPVTLTSTPTIEAGQHDGQVIRLFGTNDTNTLTLQDESSLTGSTLRLPSGGNVTLGAFDNIQLMWDEGQSLWVACSPVVTI